MPTEREAQEEIRKLRTELGIQTESEVQAEISALQQEISTLFPTFGEWNTEQDELDKRSTLEATQTFGANFLTGAEAMVDEGATAIGELFSGKASLEQAEGIYEVGKHDFVRFAKTLGGAAVDLLPTTEPERSREYRRAKENFDYYQKVRPLMVEATGGDAPNVVSFGANFVDPTMVVPLAGPLLKVGGVTLKSARLGRLGDAVSRAGDIASIPTKAVAATARAGVKGTAWVASKAAGLVGDVGELTAKGASFPRRKIADIAAGAVDPTLAGGGLLGAQVATSLSGAVPGLSMLTAAELAGYVAAKTGKGMETILAALSKEGGQQRFLQRLAQTAESPRVRKLALLLHRGGLTKFNDFAFNSLVNGTTAGTLNAALAYASGESAEGMGQAAGSGFIMGAAIPFGQPDQVGGKSQIAKDASSIKFMEAKLASQQLKEFRKLSPEARLAFATVEEAGIVAPKLTFLDGKTYLDWLRERDPNLREAPNAHFEPSEKMIYINKDGDARKGSQEAMDILTHELGHHFITEAIKTDPLFARQILSKYEAKPGEKSFRFAFTRDGAGNPIDFIDLNADAMKIAKGYDDIQSGDASISIGMDANVLAQEIGAEQFAMMMVDQPNLFKAMAPPLRTKLLQGARKVLTLFGAADPATGNPLKISISPILQRSSSVRRLYKNYVKQLEWDNAAKTEIAERGEAIPVRKGETADKAFERMFGGQGITFKESKAFRINNERLKTEAKDIGERVANNPLADEDPALTQKAADAEAAATQAKADAAVASKEAAKAKRKANKTKTTSDKDAATAAKDSADAAKAAAKDAAKDATKAKSEARKSGGGMSVSNGMLIGKRLTDDLKALFTRNDPRGTINLLINDIAEAIAQKLQVNFLYRSGKPSKYSDNELKARVVAFIGFRVTGLSKNSKGAVSLKVDAFDEAYLRNNLEVLVREGFVRNPDAFLDEAREVAANAIDDPEGRINPEGEFENELVTALFGHSESAPSIKDAKLRRLLNDGAFQHAIRTYDIESLAGIGRTGKGGIAFDYDNVKANYSPFGRLYLPQMKKGQIKSLHDLVKENPEGFTVTLKNKWADKGYVVAPEKRTEKFIKAEEFTEKALEDYIYQHEDMFDREGAYLGGWYDTNKNRYVLDVSFPLADYRDAVHTALWGDQDGIFDLQTFETIRTKDTNDRQTLPEGFREEYGESLQDLLKRKPDSNAAFAEESWRRSQSVRQEGGEGLRERAGGDESQTGQPQDASTSGRVAPKASTAKEGDVVRLNEESLRLFMPASDKVRLEDYVDRKMFALASDRLGIGRMYTGPKGKKKELPLEAQGGRGFMQIFNGGGWAFKGKQTAGNFMTRVKEVADGDPSVIVGITILSDLNHLHSAYGQLGYVNALRAAIESGTITEGMANRQIKEIVKRIKLSKAKKNPLSAESRKIIEAIKNFADFEKAVKAKKINFPLMAKIRKHAEAKTMPLTPKDAEKLELDVPSIARDIADPELVGADFGKVVALLEVPVDQTPKKTDFHYSYPYSIEGNKIGFLEEFANIGELTSDPKVRTKEGPITAQPLQTVMPEFDRLKGNRFMAAER